MEECQCDGNKERWEPVKGKWKCDGGQEVWKCGGGGKEACKCFRREASVRSVSKGKESVELQK